MLANKIFTDAMIARMRAFVAENYPTSTAALRKMLADEFQADFLSYQVFGAMRHRGIRIGHKPSPVRHNAAAMALIRTQIEAHPAHASNATLVWLIKTNLGLTVTEGQIAGAIRDAGLGGRRYRPKARKAAQTVVSVQAPETPIPPAQPQVALAARSGSWRDEATEQQRKREEMLRHALRG